jgi:hypothetical protein
MQGANLLSLPRTCSSVTPQDLGADAFVNPCLFTAPLK